jgi:hypothetical protein
VVSSWICCRKGWIRRRWRRIIQSGVAPDLVNENGVALVRASKIRYLFMYQASSSSVIAPRAGRFQQSESQPRQAACSLCTSKAIMPALSLAGG